MISVIIPAYNEESAIGGTVDAWTIAYATLKSYFPISNAFLVF